MKSGLEGPIADQVLAEAAMAFSAAVSAPFGRSDVLPWLPSEQYLGELNQSIIDLAEIAQGINGVDPWTIARNGVRRIGNGLHTARLFSNRHVQRGVIHELEKRKVIFGCLEKDWST